MKNWLKKILSGLLEEIAARLIGGGVLVAWLFALGLTGKCVAFFAPQSLFLLLMGIAALVLAIPFLALWRYLQKDPC